MLVVSSRAREASISMVVMNADGTVKRDLGVVSYWHKNPFRRWAYRLRRFFKRS